MQRLQERDDPPHPTTLNTHSFPRYESPSAKSSSTDPASILMGSPDSLTRSPPSHPSDAGPERSHSDIFDTQDENDTPVDTDGEQDDRSKSVLAELPIEIQSLMERFLESLSLKSSSAALSIDRVAELYQDFYIHVETQIATHIAALSSKLAREKSPAPSVSSAGSASSGRGGRRGPRDKPLPRKRESELPMLTASEVSERRKTRRQLEMKKLAMEEAVERGVCERVYPRLWRHSSTDDESRDAKLRSRAAALSVVGVNLKELLSTAMSSENGSTPDPSVAANTEKVSVREKLVEARASLEQINEDRYPQAKLQSLSNVHQIIVDSLSQLFPSSSSADEILPTLIYVIIISSPESLNVVSNLLFIQRFRNQSKLDGEAAYCLTNLEAAIAFLETVDLSSIRRDEMPEGPHKHNTSDSGPSTPRAEKSNPMYRGLPLSPPHPVSSGPKSPKHSRRMSQLMSSKPANPLEAASEAVDSAYDAMHNALDGSFKFLFGRIREKQATQSPAGDTRTPKTLEDARRLVTQEDQGELGDDDGDEGVLHGLGVQGTIFSPASRDEASSRMLELIGGKRSTPSIESIASTNKTPIINGTPDKTKSDNASITSQASSSGVSTASTPQQPTTGYNNAVEQVRSFGNSLNPLNFKSFSMRGFARTPSGSGPPLNKASPAPAQNLDGAQVDGAIPDAMSRPTSGAVDLSIIAPPIERFRMLKEARELNGFDIELLLRDYQRLSDVVGVLRS